jgi:septum formation protein
MNRDIILASKSETRIKLLRNAGISFEAVAHGVDEEEVKMSMSKNTPEEIVVKLAEMKALKPSMSNKSAFVIGSDQGLDLKGELINKARDRNEAKEQLMNMSGSIHTLITATTVAHDNNIIWKYVDRSKMHMRKLSEDLIKEYLNKVDDNILDLVGVYAIEEEGIKLFENIGSDLFSIQGISLIQLTQFLWDNNLLFENNGT